VCVDADATCQAALTATIAASAASAHRTAGRTGRLRRMSTDLTPFLAGMPRR
jgi:hypothetical protein